MVDTDIFNLAIESDYLLIDAFNDDSSGFSVY